MGGNGSWTGRDPRLRWLRTVAVLVLLVLIAVIILDDRPNDPATLGTLVGALLVTLGFELVRLPGRDQ